MDHEKIDGLFFITDPRFYGWLFNMSDEIKDRGIPMFYWHVWDEWGYADEKTRKGPEFNKPYYSTCDFIGCISKLTHNIVCDLGFKESSQYIPHAVDESVFRSLTKEEILTKKKETLGPNANKVVFFYNSRNARRKRTSDVLVTFKRLLDKVGQDKAFLLMKTDPNDPEGGNLVEVAKILDLTNNQITFIPQGIPAEQLNIFYNISDITVCHSSNEGFGLSCLESLYCGTPVIAMKTGGLQEQPVDEDGNVFGVLVGNTCNSMQGSQQIPYIRDCLATDQQWLDAYLKMFNMTWDERKDLGKKGSESVRRRYSMKNMIDSWDQTIVKYTDLYKQKGNPSRIKVIKV